MKPGSTFTGRLLLGAVALSTLVLVSFKFKQPNGHLTVEEYYNDTIPAKKNADRERKVRNLDEALDQLEKVNIEQELEKAMKEVDLSMKNVDKQKLQADIDKAMRDINPDKLKAEIEKAMKEVDLSNIQVQLDQLKSVDVGKAMQQAQESIAKINWNDIKLQQEKAMQEATKAMKEIDMASIQAEVELALKNIDMKKMQADVDQAMKSVDIKASMELAKESVAKINWDEMKAEMSKLQDLNINLDEQLRDIGPTVKKSLEGARAEIDKLKVQLREYKIFVDGLDKEGLIDKDKDYSIVHKDGELLINGKKAPASVTEKHRDFLKKYEKFTLKQEGDVFDMD